MAENVQEEASRLRQEISDRQKEITERQTRLNEIDRYRYREIQSSESGIYILRDDGYRIEVQWRAGKAHNVDPEEWTLWAEYKQCNYPRIGEDVANFLMSK